MNSLEGKKLPGVEALTNKVASRCSYLRLCRGPDGEDPSRLRLLRGDLTEHPADAIVNAAYADLLPGGVVAPFTAKVVRRLPVTGRLRRMDGPWVLDKLSLQRVGNCRPSM